MKSKSMFVIGLFMVLTLTLAGVAKAAEGGQIKYANGPFKYDPAVAGETTFLGSLGGPAEGGFTICAPSGGTSFPSADTAFAEISIFGIEKVADADGTPLLAPAEVPINSGLGSQIIGAFAINPTSNEFYPGSSIEVELSVSNPNVNEADYGVYIITIKGQAPGAGVGVGTGSRFKLTLRAGELVDTTPPVISIVGPGDDSEHILGQIPVSITANDPEPGSGVASISATIKSAGNGMPLMPIDLTTTTPQPAGSDATASGTFTPIGGTGTDGRTLDDAFTTETPSGIGSYELTAKAIDGAGNEATATSAFQIKYDIQFTQADAHIPGGEKKVLDGTGRFKFTVRRSASTSDGGFMFDKTVLVYLVRISDDWAVDSHEYGDGSIHQDVQIDSAEYQTNFRKEDFAEGVDQTQYKAEIWFMDVDGNMVRQAVSSPITF